MDFSIVAPMNGAGDATAAYVRSLAELARSGAEILICVADADDGAVAPTRAVWPEAPILIGHDDTFNPKMNNVRKGLEARLARAVYYHLIERGEPAAGDDGNFGVWSSGLFFPLGSLVERI